MALRITENVSTRLVAIMGNAIVPIIRPSRALIPAASCLAILLPVSTAGAQSKSEIETSSTVIPVEHVVVKTKKPYPEIKAALEGRLGRLDGSIRALLTEGKIDELRIALQKIAGKDGLAIHNVAVHGDWLKLNGVPRNGIVYNIGNVLSAVQMTRRNFGAGLYAPLRVVVYEDNSGTTFEYDKPSTLFAQFRDPKIDEVAHSLDDRLAALIADLSR